MEEPEDPYDKIIQEARRAQRDSLIIMAISGAMIIISLLFLFT